jgi:hypothetical protein
VLTQSGHPDFTIQVFDHDDHGLRVTRVMPAALSIRDIWTPSANGSRRGHESLIELISRGVPGWITTLDHPYSSSDSLNPDFEDAHLDLGTALDGTSCINEAIAHYRQCVMHRQTICRDDTAL